MRLSPRWRPRFVRASAVTPDEVYEVTVAMWDTCVRIPAGHCIRLEVASSAFPKYDVNLGTGGDMVTESSGVRAVNKIWHSAGRPSRLRLTWVG